MLLLRYSKRRSTVEILYVQLLQCSKRRFAVEILYVQYQLNIITALLQETFYRVPDLYTGEVKIFLPRDLRSLQLKYIFRAGVQKRRCGKAVWRLSATVSPAYRIDLRERRRGENFYTRPSSPLDSQTVGSCR